MRVSIFSQPCNCERELKVPKVLRELQMSAGGEGIPCWLVQGGKVEDLEASGE